MMWGVINFTVQFRQWRANADMDWTYSWILSAIVSLLPFLFGLILCKSVFQHKTPRGKS